MKLNVTYTEPFDLAALGVFNVTGRNMEERELKLWEMVETIVDDKLKSLTYKRLKKVTIWFTKKSLSVIMELMTFMRQLRLNLVSWMIFITISFILMKIDFTDAELETIAAAMDDYMCYADDEFASADDLIGGIPVRDRVTSICRKIDEVYDN